MVDTGLGRIGYWAGMNICAQGHGFDYWLDQKYILISLDILNVVSIWVPKSGLHGVLVSTLPIVAVVTPSSKTTTSIIPNKEQGAPSENCVEYTCTILLMCALVANYMLSIAVG